MTDALRTFNLSVDKLERAGHFVVDLVSLHYMGCPESEIGALNGLIGALNPETKTFEFNLNSRAILTDRLERCGMQEDEVEATISEIHDAVTHLVVN